MTLDDTAHLSWLASLTTVAIVLVYEVVQLFLNRGASNQFGRTAHARLREEWFLAMGQHPGSEIIAVQTLRNALMSATLTASTAVLGLMGTVTLAASSLHATFGNVGVALPPINATLMLELLLMVALFTAMACSAIAVRYFNHAGFIASLPVGSAERQRWSDIGVVYLRRAGVLYGWGLRALLMVAPLVVSIVHPVSGPFASLALVMVLRGFDRVGHA